MSDHGLPMIVTKRMPSARFTVQDVLDRKPDWTTAQARHWITHNRGEIEDAMVSAGNAYLDDRLGTIEEAGK